MKEVETLKIEKRGLSDFWIYVLAAFVVGLMLPDKANPYVMLLDLLNKKKDDKPTKSEGGTTEPAKTPKTSESQPQGSSNE